MECRIGCGQDAELIAADVFRIAVFIEEIKVDIDARAVGHDYWVGGQDCLQGGSVRAVVRWRFLAFREVERLPPDIAGIDGVMDHGCSMHTEAPRHSAHSYSSIGLQLVLCRCVWRSSIEAIRKAARISRYAADAETFALRNLPLSRGQRALKVSGKPNPIRVYAGQRYAVL